MQVTARLIEGVGGKRQVETGLSLHGSLEWPTDPEEVVSWARLHPGRAVDLPGSVLSRQEPLGYRILASLDVYAPDDLEVGRVEDILAKLLRQDTQFAHEAEVVVCRAVSAVLGDDGAGKAISSLHEAVVKRLRRRHAYVPIHVSRLELDGFRGIDQLELRLADSRTSVLVGANGAGKTSILDAVAILLSTLEARIRMSEAEHPLVDDDISNRTNEARIAVQADLGVGEHRWSISRERGGSTIAAADDLEVILDEMHPLRAAVRSVEPSLPLFIYYPVNRAVLDIPLRIRTKHLFEPVAAYDGALKGGSSNFRLFFEWFRNREDLENEQRIHDSDYRDGQLEAVRRAVTSLVPGFTNLRVQRAPLRMLVNKAEWTLFVNQLSDGEKCLLAMAGDLARRLAIANPLMDDPLSGGGVVLIDEIELHLHPGWQRQIIPALERTFPNCQFIITTHSPTVLGHVPAEAIHVLDVTREGIVERRPDASLGMDVNRIMEDVLGVPERPDEFKEKLLRLFRLIDEGKLEEARALRAELSAVLRAAPELARAEVLILRRERLGR